MPSVAFTCAAVLRYRNDLGMWEDDGSELRLLYVNDNVFVWQRGPQALLVVKSGLGYQSSIPINSSRIIPGTNVCLMENSSAGVRVLCSAKHIYLQQLQQPPCIIDGSPNHSFASPNKRHPFHGRRATGARWYSCSREVSTPWNTFQQRARYATPAAS